MYPVENRSSNAAAAVNRISAQRKFAGSQMEETQNYVRGQMIYQAEIPSYAFNYSSPEAVSDANIRCNFNQRVTGCPSCCPALGQAHPSHIPIFGVNNHRRSVIMVPVSWNSTVSHIPLFEENSLAPAPFFQNWEQGSFTGMDYSATDDTDSSDEEEHEEIYSPTIIAKTILRVKLRCHERRQRFP